MAEKNIEAIYRLSALQEGMLFHGIGDTQGSVYYTQYSCLLEGELQAEQLLNAWSHVIARHPVLRTLFTWEKRDQPLQLVRRRIDTPWQQLDWRDLDAEGQQRRWESLLQQDRAQKMDLERAPLLRLTLVRLQPQRWRFLWGFQHLILDGWSMRLLLDEVRQQYRAAITGRPAESTPARPYVDFISWLGRRQTAESERYWSELLSGYARPVRLVDPDASGGIPGTGTHRQHLGLSPRLASKMRAFAGERQLTLNTLLLGAWALVLARYTNSDDVVFGTTVSGRSIDLPGVDHMVGLFLNTLPMRVSLDEGLPVLDWLRQIQGRQVGMLAHEQTPLVEIQRCAAVPGGTALFDNIMVFENFPETGESHPEPGLWVRDEAYDEYSNFPLAILVVPGERFELIAVADPARYSEPFVGRLLAALQAALAGIVDLAEGMVRDVPVMSQSERDMILQSWNEPSASMAPFLAVHQQVTACARRQPDAMALIDDHRTLDYRALEAEAGRLAAHLVERGVTPGALVPIGLERCADAIVSILAVLKAGAAYVPLDPSLPFERVRAVLTDIREANDASGADGVFVLTNGELADRLDGLDCTPVCIDREAARIAGMPSDAPDIEVHPEQLAYVIYTSGTTGRPKGVMVSHANLSHSTGARAHTYPEPFDSYLMLSSLATDSSVAGVFWPLVSGACLVLPRHRIEQDIEALAGLILRNRISHLLCVPSLYSLLLEHSASAQLSSLRLVIVAGESCPARLLRQHGEMLPDVALYNEYGPSEGTVWATVARLDHGDMARAPSIGRPIVNVTAYVLDRAMHPQPVGVPGELYIGGDGVAMGYLNQPELTAARFVDNPFRQAPDAQLYRTGDLVRFRSDGRIEFLGRVDNQLKVRGYRIEPEEIEQILQTHPAVAEAVVVADGLPAGDVRVEDLLAVMMDGDTRAEGLLEEIERLGEEQLAAQLAGSSDNDYERQRP